MRIAAWNIDTVGDPNVLDPVEYEATLAILLRIDADIVALNQIAGDDDGFHLRALAMEAGYDYVVVPESNPLGPQRNAMISRFAFAEEPVFHTAESLSGHEMANDITRWVVEGSFDLPKARSLYVFVQHWKASGGNDDEFRRSLESIRMRQAFADLDLERDAVIILGDVNEEIEDAPGLFPPVFTVPTGLPQSFRLGADLEAQLAASGIINNPFFNLGVEEDLFSMPNSPRATSRSYARQSWTHWDLLSRRRALS